MNTLNQNTRKPVISNADEPVYHHGDVVEVIRRGERTVVGKIWWRMNGMVYEGKQPCYGILPLGEYSPVNNKVIIADQDQIRLSEVHHA